MICYFLPPSKKSHIAKLEDLLKALLTNELKISPKKCQLFRKELQYIYITIYGQYNIYTKQESLCKTIKK